MTFFNRIFFWKKENELEKMLKNADKKIKDWKKVHQNRNQNSDTYEKYDTEEHWIQISPTCPNCQESKLIAKPDVKPKLVLYCPNCTNEFHVWINPAQKNTLDENKEFLK